ncbi:hypothetical protein BT96DRAFT_1009717, partial [Gymnopus androsaceus JB14]
AGLETNLYLHPIDNEELAEETTGCINAYSVPVLTVLVQILESISSRTSGLVIVLFNSAGFTKALAHTWIAALRFDLEYGRVIVDMMEQIDKKRRIFGVEILTGFLDVLYTEAFSVAGMSFIDLWGHIVKKEIVATSRIGQQTFDTARLYLLVRLVGFLTPFNVAFLLFDVAATPIRGLDYIWRILADSQTILNHTGSSTAGGIRLWCIYEVLKCQDFWISGGPLWAVALLRRHLLVRMSRTCHFLHDMDLSGDGVRELTESILRMIHKLLLSVHRYKAFHCVGYRVCRNLDALHVHGSGFYSLSEESRGETLVNEIAQAWLNLSNEFSNPDQILERKSCWAKGLQKSCAVFECDQKHKDPSYRPRLCSRCKVFAYCDSDCQRQHFQMIHKFECPRIETWMNGHPVLGSGRYILPQTEKAYILHVLQNKVIERRSEILPLITVLDLVSEPSAIVVDLTTVATTFTVKPQASMSDETNAQHKLELEQQKPPLICCARVPLDAYNCMFVSSIVDLDLTVFNRLF